MNSNTLFAHTCTGDTILFFFHSCSKCFHMENCIYNQGQVGNIHTRLWMHKVYFMQTDCILLCRRSSLPFCMTTSKAVDGADPAKCTKVVNELMTGNSRNCSAPKGERTNLSLVFSWSGFLAETTGRVGPFNRSCHSSQACRPRDSSFRSPWDTFFWHGPPKIQWRGHTKVDQGDIDSAKSN